MAQITDKRGHALGKGTAQECEGRGEGQDVVAGLHARRPGNGSRVMDPLEQDAIAMYRRYRFLLPAEVKAFFVKLAARLGWQNLAREVGQ